MLSISNYHYIRHDFTADYPSIFGVTPAAFQKQLLLLKNNADFVSAADLLSDGDDILASKDNYFFITFDDGLKEQYELALPVLDSLNVPAVFFANSSNYSEKKVSTVHKIHLLRSKISAKDFLRLLAQQAHSVSLSAAEMRTAESTYLYDDAESAAVKYLLNFKMEFSVQEELINAVFGTYFDENQIRETLYMDESQIIQLGQNRFLGSHTHNHYPLALLPNSQIQYELENSKLFFENLTGSKIYMVAYPYGTKESCTETVADNAKMAGYTFGFTTNRGSNSEANNPLLLNRFDCNDLPGGKNYKGS